MWLFAPQITCSAGCLQLYTIAVVWENIEGSGFRQRQVAQEYVRRLQVLVIGEERVPSPGVVRLAN